MQPQDGIDWDHISREDFERFVEALLVRWWQSVPEMEAHAIDGRGGDGGIDVDVTRNGEVVRVYQLKHFPEGMSGDWGRSRRPQVKRSFDKTADIETLEDWTLVLPRNVTQGESKVIHSMRAGRAVRMHIIGRAELDEMFAQHPDLLRLATRNAVIELLRQAGHESAALASPRDLDKRALDLARLADTRDEYWGQRFTADPTGVRSEFYAKRPDAHERSPIKVTFNARFGPGDEKLLSSFEKARDYGATEPIILPASVVEQFEFLGPDIMESGGELLSVEMHPQPLADPLACDLRVLSVEGSAIASLDGKITAVAGGRKGFTIQTRIRDAIDARFSVDTSNSAGEFSVSYDVSGMRATDALAVLRFMKQLQDGDALELLVNGQSVFRTRDLSDATSGQDLYDDSLLSFADDLDYLEHEFGLSMRLPEDITIHDEIDARVARRLAEGRCIIWPSLTAFNGTLSGAFDADVREVFTGPHPQSARLPGWTVEVQGQQLPMGTLRTYHPSVEFDDAPAALAALEAGTAAGRAVTARPTDGTLFRVWIEERWDDPSRPLIAEALGIDGVPELPGTGIGRDGSPSDA